MLDRGLAVVEHCPHLVHGDPEVVLHLPDSHAQSGERVAQIVGDATFLSCMVKPQRKITQGRRRVLEVGYIVCRLDGANDIPI
jgi:hypothetical protein